jgi:hypothetical protein
VINSLFQINDSSFYSAMVGEKASLDSQTKLSKQFCKKLFYLQCCLISFSLFSFAYFWVVSVFSFFELQLFAPL